MSNITYNIAGQVISSEMANGVEEEFGYDAARLQMTSQTASNTWNDEYQGPPPIPDPVTDVFLDLSYDYEASAGEMGASSTAGNAGQLMGISGTIDGQTESAAYTYDNLGRLLISSQITSEIDDQRRFMYEGWGIERGVGCSVRGSNSHAC